VNFGPIRRRDEQGQKDTNYNQQTVYYIHKQSTSSHAEFTKFKLLLNSVICKSGMEISKARNQIHNKFRLLLQTTANLRLKLNLETEYS
jgi:hypothetical protein